jgi:penicillin-binding protein 2
MSNLFKNFSSIDLGRKNSSYWVEESCDLTGDCSSGIKTGFLSLSMSENKIRLFFLFIFFTLIILLLRSFFLQVLAGDSYLLLAESNRVKIEYNKAHRGIFFDRNGKILVNNLFGFSVYILPLNLSRDQQEKEIQLKRISQVIGVEYEEIIDKLKDTDKRYFQPVLVKTGIPYDRAMLLKIDQEELSALDLRVDAWRLYTEGESLSHLLGYIGKINPEEYETKNDTYLLDDNIGRVGLEKQYESYLKGVNGIKRIEVDALGREKKILSQTEFTPGSNIILTIDSALQNKIYAIFKEKFPQGKGSVIASDCSNGEILAMVDYPSYDNNLFTGGIKNTDYQNFLNDERKPLFTRSIFGEYPSGSTIKPIVSLAALAEKVINKNTIINSVGGISIGRWFFPDWKAGGHGPTNVTKAIAWSVNTFYYYIGGGHGDFRGLGIDNLVKYFKMFGLAEKTGIDLPGERSGLVPDAEWKKKQSGESWYIGDTYHLSIGQGGLLVTPLQINNFTVAIANGGSLFVPRLVLGVIDDDGKKEKFGPKVIEQLPIDSEHFKTIKQGMRETVIYGSGRSLANLQVMVSGKTGTAQWHSEKENHAWFTGFAPYEKPNFCLTVLIEEGGEGSSVAVPVAKEVFQWWFFDRYLQD